MVLFFQLRRLLPSYQMGRSAVKGKPLPMPNEPDGRDCFQREMSLKGARAGCENHGRMVLHLKRPNGRPGYVRVDAVQQGDRGKVKGV